MEFSFRIKCPIQFWCSQLRTRHTGISFIFSQKDENYDLLRSLQSRVPHFFIYFSSVLPLLSLVLALPFILTLMHETNHVRRKNAQWLCTMHATALFFSPISPQSIFAHTRRTRNFSGWHGRLRRLCFVCVCPSSNTSIIENFDLWIILVKEQCRWNLQTFISRLSHTHRFHSPICGARRSWGEQDGKKMKMRTHCESVSFLCFVIYCVVSPALTFYSKITWNWQYFAFNLSDQNIVCRLQHISHRRPPQWEKATGRIFAIAKFTICKLFNYSK